MSVPSVSHRCHTSHRYSHVANDLQSCCLFFISTLHKSDLHSTAPYCLAVMSSFTHCSLHCLCLQFLHFVSHILPLSPVDLLTSPSSFCSTSADEDHDESPRGTDSDIYTDTADVSTARRVAPSVLGASRRSTLSGPQRLPPKPVREKDEDGDMGGGARRRCFIT